jgi:hypothetical protein
LSYNRFLSCRFLVFTVIRVIAWFLFLSWCLYWSCFCCCLSISNWLSWFLILGWIFLWTWLLFLSITYCLAICRFLCRRWSFFVRVWVLIAWFGLCDFFREFVGGIFLIELKNFFYLGTTLWDVVL